MTGLGSSTDFLTKYLAVKNGVKGTLPMFTKDGVMPEGGPEIVEKFLKAFNPNVQKADVDLSRTCTTEFVEKAAG